MKTFVVLSTATVICTLFFLSAETATGQEGENDCPPPSVNASSICPIPTLITLDCVASNPSSECRSDVSAVFAEFPGEQGDIILNPDVAPVIGGTVTDLLGNPVSGVMMNLYALDTSSILLSNEMGEINLAPLYENGELALSDRATYIASAEVSNGIYRANLVRLPFSEDIAETFLVASVEQTPFYDSAHTARLGSNILISGPSDAVAGVETDYFVGVSFAGQSDVVEDTGVYFSVFRNPPSDIPGQSDVVEDTEVYFSVIRNPPYSILLTSAQATLNQTSQESFGYTFSEPGAYLIRAEFPGNNRSLPNYSELQVVVRYPVAIELSEPIAKSGDSFQISGRLNVADASAPDIIDSYVNAPLKVTVVSSGERSLLSQSVPVSAEGEFVFETEALPFGRTQLIFELEQSDFLIAADASTSLIIRPGVSLTLEPDPAPLLSLVKNRGYPITGRVNAPEGVALQGIQVKATFTGEPQGIYEAVTDALGQFTLTHTPKISGGGIMRIDLVGESIRPFATEYNTMVETVTLQASMPAIDDFSRGETVLLEGVASLAGVAYAGETVDLRLKGKELDTVTDANGRFAFSFTPDEQGLENGIYEIAYFVPQFDETITAGSFRVHTPGVGTWLIPGGAAAASAGIGAGIALVTTRRRRHSAYAVPEPAIAQNNVGRGKDVKLTAEAPIGELEPSDSPPVANLAPPPPPPPPPRISIKLPSALAKETGDQVWGIGEEISLVALVESFTEGEYQPRDEGLVTINVVSLSAKKRKPHLEMESTLNKGVAEFSFSIARKGFYAISVEFTDDGGLASATERLQFVPPPPRISIKLPSALAKETGDRVWGIGEEISLAALVESFTEGEYQPRDEGLVTINVVSLSAKKRKPHLEMESTLNKGVAEFSFSIARKGFYAISVEFTDEGGLASATERLQFVSYKEETVKMYEEFRGKHLEPIGPVPRSATPREMEQILTSAGLVRQQKALEELVSVHQYAEYSKRTMTRNYYIRTLAASKLLASAYNAGEDTNENDDYDS